MFNFFSRKKTGSFITPGIDIHNHLLPGLDDGAPDLETSLELIRGMIALGYHTLVLTPHIMHDYYPNSELAILEATTTLQKACRDHDIDVHLIPAAEYYLDEHFLKKIKDGTKLLTFGDRFLLFETPFLSEPGFMKEAVFLLNSNNYRPVLAHPERYTYLRMQPHKIEELSYMNVLLQVNLLSLAGFYEPVIKKFAKNLITKKMISFAASDCHNMQQLKVLDNYLHSPEAIWLEDEKLLHHLVTSDKSI
ncbi:MAG: capsular biosynthesis protein [Cyclobacteriaceae bacterium]|nr:capsular biosynthesis protein [Cyclobacteriaceae bacterium]